MNSLSRDFDLAREERLNDFVDQVLKIASEFEDWYFDISGKFGKAQLIKTPLDMESGSSNSQHKWTPYLGQFFTNGDQTVARVA
jgi:hypothetical protein